MAQVNKRILIVDDEKDVGRTLEMILENYGFDIDCFTDPVVALESFKPNVYDLTILDIRMPKINGFELYHELKSRDSNIKTLFISALSYLTAYKTYNSKVYPIEGERKFIKKPVTNKELLEQVYAMVR
jgi:DNA-binding response OmpR family regulator